MPNWCNNTVTVSGDTESIDKFEKFLDEKSGKEWFDFILPCPEELKNTEASFHKPSNEVLVEKYGHSDWYTWSLEKWGCKWNCDAQDWERDGDTITFWFDSPWGPPITLYEEMENHGFNVEAYYHEEGMAFVGKFTTEYGDDNFEYSDLESLDDIPEDIVDYWGLREMIEDRMDEMEEYNEWDSSDEPEDFTTDTAKDWIKGLLKDGVVEVTFTKSDGTERVMKCTLKDEVISEHWIPKNTESQRKFSDDALPVFDVDSKGWRSFRWDSIKEVNFSLE
jgi:hypothetical protein